MRACLIAACTVILLVACAAPPKAPEGPALTPEQVDPGPLPPDYELRIISWLRMNSTDPDNLQVISIQTPHVVALDRPAPEAGLEKGERVWEAIAYTQVKGRPAAPAVHRFHFKDGVIKAVYDK